MGTPPKTPAQSGKRTQAERSEDMRLRLAQAAYEVIVERGHSAFRTASVVSQAGVSQGALLHHFPNKEAVTLAAIEYALDRALEASNARIARASNNAREVLDLMAEDFRDFFLGGRFWAALDITMDAAKDMSMAPAIRASVSSKRGPVFESWAQCLVNCGWTVDRATKVVKMLASIISGYAIRTLWTDDGDALDQALNELIEFMLEPPR